MKIIRCLIVEDEHPATEFLKGCIQEFPNWTVVKTCTNALEAMTYLASQAVDVLFVDIQLPKLSGIDFIKSLENPPLLVITTAYNEHAVEAFELQVVDYLLKPYSFQRFVKTAQRINERLLEPETAPSAPEEDFLLVRENRVVHKVLFDEIVYIESQKEYVCIVCADRKVKTKIGIGQMEERLPAEGFTRVHRSFLVATAKITALTGRSVRLGEHTVPLGRHYRKDFLQKG